MPSKSRLSLLRGVSRWSSGPGRWRSTVRSRPTSLSAPRVAVMPGLYAVPQAGLSESDLRLQRGELDDADDREDKAHGSGDVVQDGQPDVPEQEAAGENGEPRDGEQGQPGAEEHR